MPSNTNRIRNNDVPGVDPRATPANALKTYAEHKLNNAGWRVFRVNAGKRGKAAVHKERTFIPDIIGYDPQGRFIGLEIKVGNDKLTKGQQLVLQDINKTEYGRADVITHYTDIDNILSFYPKWMPNAEVVEL